MLPFPHSTAGGFEARRGSRATRAVPCASGRQPGGSAGGLGTARRDTGWGQPKNRAPRGPRIYGSLAFASSSRRVIDVLGAAFYFC